MKKFFGCLLLTAVCFLTGTLAAEKLVLERDVVRLHVVAASDSSRDQARKLEVRDAVCKALEEVPQEGLRQALPALQALAERTLEESGQKEPVKVLFGKESFETRQGEDGALPAGTYHTLRVIIGEGRGHNWWGVVFPRLCYGSSMETWAGGQGTVRFYALEKLGQAETWVTEKMSKLLDR